MSRATNRPRTGFTERVTVRRYHRGALEPAGAPVAAFRREIAGVLHFYIAPACDAPTPKSEVRTAGGTVFVVARVASCAQWHEVEVFVAAR